MKWLLSIKLKRQEDKILSESIINEFLSQIKKNANNNYHPSFKLILNVLAISYTKDEILEPHYSLYNLLEKIDLQYIRECSNPANGDISWLNKDWLRIFKNLVKIGLTEATTTIFLSLARNFASLKYFDVLLKVQDEVVPMLILPLKIEKWQGFSLEIQKFFLLDGPTNSSLLEKILTKLFDTLRDNEAKGYFLFTEELAGFIYNLSLKYSKTVIYDSINNKIHESSHSTFIKNIFTKLTTTETIVNFTNWTSMNKLNNQELIKIPYRGMTNIGNSN